MARLFRHNSTSKDFNCEDNFSEEKISGFCEMIGEMIVDGDLRLKSISIPPCAHCDAKKINMLKVIPDLEKVRKF